MARKDTIRKGVTGGVDPSSIRLTYSDRRQARQAANRQAREINKARQEKARKLNASRWEKARAINQQRRAEATAQWEEATKAPDLGSNENLQRALSENEDTYNRTQATIDDQERGLGIGYGLGRFGADAASNPYSRAALLQRSYDQNQRATTNTMAARGQLYSGATQNAADLNAGNYSSAYDALSKDFAAREQRLKDARFQAETARVAGTEAAYRKAVDENQKLYASTSEDAPKFQPAVKFAPKKFTPRLEKIKPVIPRRRPKLTGTAGGVRP